MVTAGTVYNIAAGDFSFLPQGAGIALRQARSLRGPAEALLTTVRDTLPDGSRSSTYSPLQALGYLIGSSPITPAARSAAWQAVASLPHVTVCGNSVDIAGRSGVAVCATESGEEVSLIVDPRSGAVLAVADTLLRSDASLPGIKPGTVLVEEAFEK